MIEFFRDVISGPVYIITTIVSVIFIMAIIGFLMERKKLEKEKQEQVVTNPSVVSNATPLNSLGDNSQNVVNEPVIVFNESQQKE